MVDKYASRYGQPPHCVWRFPASAVVYALAQIVETEYADAVADRQGRYEQAVLNSAIHAERGGEILVRAERELDELAWMYPPPDEYIGAARRAGLLP